MSLKKRKNIALLQKSKTVKRRKVDEAEEDVEFWKDYELVSELQSVPLEKASLIVELFKNENTIPFLCRYRRNLIGSEMTPEKLSDLKSSLNEVINIKKKAQSVLKTLKNIGKLTTEIKYGILKAKSIEEIEHQYEPHKEKKTGLYQKAIDLGLLNVSQKIWSGTASVTSIQKYVQRNVVGLETIQKVEQGILIILSYMVAKNSNVLEQLTELRNKYNIMLKTTLIRRKLASKNDNKTEYEATKFENYAMFSSSTKLIKPHQILAINRGESLKTLSVHVDVPRQLYKELNKYFTQTLIKKYQYYNNYEQTFLQKAFDNAYFKTLNPLLCRQIRNKLTRHAQTKSIKVFGTNLKQLLLTTPCCGLKILGIDPGFIHGCKCAIISEAGELLETLIIYPHNQRKAADDGLRLAAMMKKYACKLIALGNGTACRETETWITKLIEGKVLHSQTKYSIVSEQGASVYSCSTIALKEFKNLDINLISACSIARRLQNPLAEYVKCDPKTLGVGQYQHDMNQRNLNDTLKDVVVECVSFVGVDVNTASVELLTHIAGLSDKRAENIIVYRNTHGPFKSREDLKKVNLIGPKTYLQAAGFIVVNPKSAQIMDKQYNLLDSTTIHPESYEIAKHIIKVSENSIIDIGEKDFINKIQMFKSTKRIADISQSYKVPIETVESLFDALTKKPFHDFRFDENNKPLFKTEITKMSSLLLGTVLTGRVMNETDFGAFIDIGVETNGLIHKSNMNGIKLKVGNIIQVHIINLDIARRRIGLKLQSVVE